MHFGNNSGKNFENAMYRPGGELKAKTSWVPGAPKFLAQPGYLVLRVDGILFVTMTQVCSGIY